MALICDGPNCNRVMLTELGASLDPSTSRPFFHSPSGKKVYVMLDVAHMIKLVRNTFANQRSFIDREGDVVKWVYLEELEALQQTEGLRLGNKITRAHIYFQRQKMTVRLATQLLSSSVASAIDFCNKVLHMPQFQVSRKNNFLYGCARYRYRQLKKTSQSVF